MQTLMGKHWHHMPAEEVIQLLETNLERGLDLFEIQQRQKRFGRNQLTPDPGKPLWLRFLLQFHNPLIYILLAAAVITVVLKQDWVDATIIFGVVFINALVGTIQEARAENAIRALAQTLVTEAAVVRSGKPQRIPAEQLVPGDVVVLKGGDRVPADMRLIRVRDLQIVEAALTGESTAVYKQVEKPLVVDALLAERNNMAYTSTLVTYGMGTGIVVATGDNTEIGSISKMIASAEEMVTPLTRKIEHFSRRLLFAILGLAAVTFAVGVLRGKPPVDTFTATIALAVAAIPEGLPAALTVTLAIGVSRMARRRAIIRKLPAVETLGSVTVICSDKTGTLTQNQMTVLDLWAGGQDYKLKGSGYNPQGDLLDWQGSRLADAPPVVKELLRAGALCNDGGLIHKDGQWLAEGDPTEVALLVSARKIGLDETKLRQTTPRLDEIPFESEHQYMVTAHNGADGQPHRIYLKGALEVVLERCANAAGTDLQPVALDREQVLTHAEQLAGRGLRVLGFAYADLTDGMKRITHADVAGGLTFLGLQAMIDPPRAEAIDAVQASLQAGIRVKMITGDHARTAQAIAGQLGLLNGIQSGESAPVLTGRDLAELTNSELIEAAQRVHVFARVSPEQKLRLVQALQARGEIVAMTGDGVNDGPALKQADIGIAMGITGTEVAKEAADMVLTDDNFATIEAAVEEGRGVFDNLTKIIAWTLPTNVGLGLIILTAVLLGVLLPILPGQVLWINMTTVVVLGMVLALEGKEADIMQRKPRAKGAPILTVGLIWRVLLVGFLILVGAFGLFEWQLHQGSSIEVARSVSINTVVAIQTFYLFNTRSFSQSIFKIGLLSNRWAIGGVLVMALLQFLFTYTPIMNRIFQTTPIPAQSWGMILGVALSVFLLIELEKWVVLKVKNGRAG
ncbi:MAG: cation-transporting P-type ATPase [Chloroflexota bacterium]